MISLHGYVAAEPDLGIPDTGGQVVYVLELARRFARLGRKVDLVTRRFEEQPEFDEVNDNLRVWRIPFGGKKFIRKEDMHEHLNDFVTNFLSTIRVRRVSYDILYSHYWDAGWAGQKIAEELQIPHIHTPHSLGSWKQQNMMQDAEKSAPELEKVYRFHERIRKEYLVYQLCDQIIATTDLQQELLKEEYGVLERRIAVIPPGMDENRFSPVPPTERKMLRNKFKMQSHDVLALGRLAANKGYDLLLHSLPTLLRLIPDARLIAALGGDDSEQDRKEIVKLKKLAKEIGIDDKIIWEQYVPDEALADYYRAAGVFSLSSRYEPFGMVAAEAMACGTPSVITVHGGLYELIRFGHHALFADPNRPEEFGTMLALPLMYEKLAHELSVNGARFSRRQFGWTGIAKRILYIFDSLRTSRAAELHI
ncbi:glycosyltransferase [candidate division KSB1 bacterium]|nr:glycosyltransferase [candidate division KSB1 bacterium]RQW11363.1 MAG: glycosyltransferase family 1 protein [candidate division KSB1 bacterium]